jgi:hypothetical protein
MGLDFLKSRSEKNLDNSLVSLTFRWKDSYFGKGDPDNHFSLLMNRERGVTSTRSSPFSFLQPLRPGEMR